MTDERLRALERRALASGDPADREAWLAERGRAGQVPGVGIVFLEDLVGYTQSGHSGRWRAERGLDGPLLPPTVLPPPAVVVVATSSEELVGAVDWLRLADAVVVVASGDVGGLRDAVPNSWRWLSGGSQLLSPETLQNALSLAARQSARGWRWLGIAERRPSPPEGEVASPWLEVAVHPVLGLEELAPRLCAPGGRPALLEPGQASRLDLRTGERTPVSGLSPDGPHVVVAAAASGTAWFRMGDRGKGAEWSAEGVPIRAAAAGGWGRAIGVDPWGRVAWSGSRSWFGWQVPTAEGLAYWTTSDRDWPCGHARKLYGFEDNDPLWVHVAFDASACLSVYGHDVLLVPGLPLRWRDLGHLALAERTTGPPRALLFQRTEGPDAYPANPLDAQDDDARDRRATVTLGPSAEARYAVGLEVATYRLVGDGVTLLGGPTDEWVVYDEAHVERQRRPGRLLGGWDRSTVVLEGEELARVDLISGERHGLGPPGRPFTDVVPIAGTPHVLLVQLGRARNATTAWVRVV